MKPTSHDRIEALVSKLSVRRRWRWAARIYGDWLGAQPADGDGAAFRSPIRLWRYGRLLRDAGDMAGAANVFRELALRMAQEHGPIFFLHRSFAEWARCLEALGSLKSAHETRALGKRIVAQREVDLGEPLKSLQPSRLIRPVASRCTFLLALAWKSTSEAFDLVVEDGFVTLRDQFRPSETSDTWCEFEAKAPAEPEPQYPHVAVCMKFPWRFGRANIASALALVNEMNLDNAACSTCLEPDTGQIAVRSRIAFSGFNDGTEPMVDLATAQEEATINMMLEVIGMAGAWEASVAALNLAQSRGAE
jgi:hypothetical protein